MRWRFWQEPGKRSSMEDIPDSGSPKGQAIGLCMALKMGIQQMTGKPAAIKMIGGGRAQDPAVAEAALASGQCDFIFIGKEFSYSRIW